MCSLRQDAESIFLAGVDAVRAQPLVERVVEVDQDHLVINGHRWHRADYDRLVVVGAGKAGTAMATGLMVKIGDWLPVSGWINVPEGTVPPGESISGIHVHAARPAAVNEPTEAGVRGTEAILELVSGCSERDLCIALISGGGSALLPAPAEGITLEDKLAVTRLLSGGGADITELNTVRKQLSRVKGGGLKAACSAGHMITLVLSDVLGDPLDFIASGPTVADSSTAEDALAVLEKFDPQHSLPDRIYHVLQSGGKPATAHDPTESTVLVIGNNAVAVEHATVKAQTLGYACQTDSANQCEGLAEDIGRQIADAVFSALDSPLAEPKCLITGGEPTVQLAPPDRRGVGGRNQQLVLAAYKHLLSIGLSRSQWKRVVILSGGTDGEDGPTNAAGAVLDADVHTRAAELGLNVDDYLMTNDAYTFFDQCGGLIMTGPTGTNVCDVRVAIVAQP